MCRCKNKRIYVSILLFTAFHFLLLYCTRTCTHKPRSVNIIFFCSVSDDFILNTDNVFAFHPEWNRSKKYPHTGSTIGPKNGIVVRIHLKERDIDTTCSSREDGFKIYLHDPNDIPQTSAGFFYLPLSRKTLVAVKSNVMTTSLDLLKEKPEKRQCYFENERKLMYFKRYNHLNCELECLTNFTIKRCNCAKFSMPRK